MSATILVVDDAATSREPVATVLRRNGYEIVRAATGRDALELLASGDAIHLVLLDLVMPEMGGIEFLRRLRNDPRFSSLPVIVLTGLGADEAPMKEARQLGVREYLVKSRYTIDTLLNLVQRNLGAFNDTANMEDAFEDEYLGLV
jgi:two-component system chemotaxis response regulator CheY